VFDNKMTRKIYKPNKRKKVRGGHGKSRSEELHNLYSSPNTSEMIKSKHVAWLGSMEHMGEMRNAYTILIAEGERKRALSKPRSRRKNNIKTDLKDAGWEGVI
jgi:hypothetical protein